MQKHGREQRRNRVARQDVDRDRGPLVDEGIAALQLEKEDQRVDEDNDAGGDGIVHPAPRCVS